MRVILLGPPGAGKGTQAKVLCEKYGMVHVSTGELLRSHIENGTEIGIKVKPLLDKGQLVADEDIQKILHHRISERDCRERGFLLDGFPRTVPQAEMLSKMFEDMRLQLTGVVQLMVPDHVVLDRISSRGQGSGRSDDNLDVAKKRLEVYWDQTAPVAKYYRQDGKLREIDGQGEIQEVARRIGDVLTVSRAQAGARVTGIAR